MAPSHLQGLNIVHPAPPPNPYLSDADLLSVPPFSDLNAQLDLWTNLNFQSDEPLVRREHGKGDLSFDRSGRSSGDSDDDGERYDDQEEDLQNKGQVAEITSHENVVTGTVLPPTGVAHHGVPPAPAPAPTNINVPGLQMPPFDIGSLLAGFGIDPFLAPPVAPAPANPAVGGAPPSISQLLSMHAAFRPPSSAPGAQPMQPAAAAQASAAQSAGAPAPKRTRTARNSVSSVAPPIPEPETPESPEPDDEKMPLNAAEDKRRRNTAASARFRLKKKEREAALERKAKELEVRVSELEKECEALRRENGWLKGLVVGVTGAGAVQQQQATAVVSPSSGAGAKRGREDSEANE